MFTTTTCRFVIAQTVSQIMGLASNMSMDAHAALARVAKYAISTLEQGISFSLPATF